MILQLLRYPRTRTDLETRIVEDEVIVLDVVCNRVHQLNPSASYIWHRCDGQHSVSDIAAGLSADYAVPVDGVLHDVQQALAEFDRLGLMTD